MIIKELRQDKPRLRKIEDEVWKTIDCADSNYEISNYGRIKSFVKNKNGRILKGSLHDGFLVVGFKVKGEIKQYCVHKLTAEHFVPKDNDKQSVVIHLDWNLKNNHFSNLQWVTEEESRSRISKRSHEINRTKGIVSYTTKLKPEDIKLLKSMLERGVRQNVIAKMFCISEMQVTRIKRGECWGHISTGTQKHANSLAELSEFETN